MTRRTLPLDAYDQKNEGTGVRGYSGREIQEDRGTGVQRYKGTGVRRGEGTKVRGYRKRKYSILRERGIYIYIYIYIYVYIYDSLAQPQSEFL